MVNYSCEKCGKEFSQKGYYTKHLNKKNPCVVESKLKEVLDKVINEKLENIKLSNNLENNKVFQHNYLSTQNECVLLNIFRPNIKCVASLRKY